MADDEEAAEAPRPHWRSGGPPVTAALTRFREMGFDPERASELVTSTARILSEMLRADEESGAHHEAIVGAMRAAAQIASIAVREVREDRQATRLPVLQAACAAGCAYCCSLHVSISAPEALVMAAFLRDTMPEADLESLREELRRFAATVRSMDQSARVRAKLPCPLLVEGRCAVYPVRPLVCAGATSLDASACARALEDPESKIPIEPIVYGALRAVQLGLSTAICAEGLDLGRYELAGALHVALAPDAAARWAKGERIFTRSAADVAVDTLANVAEAFVTRDVHLPRAAPHGSSTSTAKPVADEP